MWLRNQMRNIAPFATLLCLVVFFTLASPSFATLDNLANILTQISVTGIIAVGLTFVILCGEIDLSVAAVANATGIVVAYFTAQDTYVNIANMPLPGWAAILLALAACAALGLVNAFGLTLVGIPSFIMTLGHDADRRRHLGPAGARPDRLCGAAGRHDARQRHRSTACPGSCCCSGCSCWSPMWCSATRASAATSTWWAATARRPNIRA